MQDKVITVSGPDQTVTVDGRRIRCLPEPDKSPRAVRSMRWDPSVQNWPGYVEYADASGHGFKDFARVKPYADLWGAQKALDDEAEAIKAAHAEAAQRRLQAEHDALAAKEEADLAAQAPVNAAYTGLVLSDHEVIKAMEDKLVAEGALDPEMVAKRRAWRNVIKAERAKGAK